MRLDHKTQQRPARADRECVCDEDICLRKVVIRNYFIKSQELTKHKNEWYSSTQSNMKITADNGEQKSILNVGQLYTKHNLEAHQHTCITMVT